MFKLENVVAARKLTYSKAERMCEVMDDAKAEEFANHLYIPTNHFLLVPRNFSYAWNSSDTEAIDSLQDKSVYDVGNSSGCISIPHGAIPTPSFRGRSSDIVVLGEVTFKSRSKKR